MTRVPSPVIGRIGHEREPIVVIDGFSSDPEALLERAAGEDYQVLGPFYPGVRAPLEAGYLAERMDLLQQVLQSAFGLEAGANLVECNFSLVTTPPSALSMVQRLPHFDSTDPGRIAILHYLCGPECGGTAFYRHRSSGFETVSASRMEDYTQMLEDEIRQRGEPAAGYLGGDTYSFEQTYRVNAAFNRLVIYRGWTLHSGLIPDGHALPADARTGRLTINTFLHAR